MYSVSFVKRWYRKYSSCARTDVEFIPLPDAKFLRRRAERESEARAKQQAAAQRSSSSAVSVVKDGRKFDGRHQSRDRDEEQRVSRLFPYFDNV